MLLLLLLLLLLTAAVAVATAARFILAVVLVLFIEISERSLTLNRAARTDSANLSPNSNAARH